MKLFFVKDSRGCFLTTSFPKKDVNNFWNLRAYVKVAESSIPKNWIERYIGKPLPIELLHITDLKQKNRYARCMEKILFLLKDNKDIKSLEEDL